MLRSRYGVDDRGMLPYETFARALFAGAAKQLAARGFRLGPLQLTQPATWGLQTMLKYPQCTKAVLPPSGWDG
jgi:hypothetical protein|eukprot:COSAG01_NODE_11715_length_1874_cov_1.406761_2_plen_73_part_00